MFNFFKKPVNNSDTTNDNTFLLNNILKYNNYFYKCVGNILNENNKIYNDLLDSNFPKFNISDISISIFKDMLNSNAPFTFVINDNYYMNLIKYDLKNTNSFKYFRKSVIENFEVVNGKGQRTQIINLFNTNLDSITLQISNVILAKLNNNCLVNYESEKVGYGVRTEEKADYFIERIEKYYFYFVDTIVSATLIAYLMTLSVKTLSSKNANEEFYTILTNMINETADNELVYKKGYELLQNIYSSEYSYLEEEEHFKVFVKMVRSLNKDENENYSEEIINFIEKFKGLNPFGFVRKMAVDLLYVNDNQLTNIIISLIKKESFDSVEKLFQEISSINKNIDIYKQTYKTQKLKMEKEQYLKGDFSSLKEEEKYKQSLENIKTGTEFEKYLVKLFKDMGYESKHTGKAGDQGCDLLLKKNDITYCVQAKFYNSPLNNTPVQEIIGSLKFYNGNKGVVITNSTFTQGARDLANKNDIILINGRKLQKLINYLYSDNDVNRDILDEIDYL